MFYLLLTLALDMSLPEFQPTPDISGNYIVSSVSENESSVELLSELPPITYAAVNEADNTAIVDAINESISHNDAYWELFLDSYPIEVSHDMRSLYKAPLTWRFTSAGLIDHTSATNGRIAYIPVNIGVTYNISDVTSGGGFTQNYRVGVVDDIENPTQVTNFVSNSSLFNGVSITPSMNGYLVFFMFNYTHEIGFTADWVTIEQESYTLSELGSAVTQSYDKLVSILMCVSGCELILLFSAVVPFLTKVIDKLMNKKED